MRQRDLDTALECVYYTLDRAQMAREALTAAADAFAAARTHTDRLARLSDLEREALFFAQVWIEDRGRAR